MDPFSGVWDIRAQHVTDGTRRTVARDTIGMLRPIGKETQTSVDIHTTEEPAPFGGGGTGIVVSDGVASFVVDGVTWRFAVTSDNAPPGYVQLKQPDGSPILQVDGTPIYTLS